MTIFCIFPFNSAACPPIKQLLGPSRILSFIMGWNCDDLFISNTQTLQLPSPPDFYVIGLDSINFYCIGFYFINLSSLAFNCSSNFGPFCSSQNLLFLHYPCPSTRSYSFKFNQFLIRLHSSFIYLCFLHS